MSFDIQQPVLTADGEYLEQAVIHYREQLTDRFVASPEGHELVQQGGAVGWADTLMDLGIGYLGVTPTAIMADELKSIQFELLPRKVSAEPECGQGIIAELRAFWRFLQREFGLPRWRLSAGPDDRDSPQVGPRDAVQRGPTRRRGSGPWSCRVLVR
jgi:hypothetical protein